MPSRDDIGLPRLGRHSSSRRQNGCCDRWRMLMISIVSMRLGNLVEKMMYLMGRRID